MLPRRLLFATDFSSASARARQVALAVARSLDADLTVLHVLEPPPFPYPAQALESAKCTIELELDRVTDDCRRGGVRAERLLLVGVPADEIIATAEDHGIDWIIVGTHGRRGVSHLLLGSVADQIVRLSPVPVLTVRSPPDAPADSLTP